MALTPEERRLLALYRDAEGPPPAVRARVLAALANVAPGKGPSAHDVGPRMVAVTPKGSFAGAISALAVKVSVVLLAFAIPVAWQLARRSPPPSEVAPAKVSGAAAAPSAGPWVSSPALGSEALATPFAIVLAPSSRSTPTPVRPVTVRPPRAVAVVPRPSSRPAPLATSEGDPLAEEVRLLTRANEALRAGNPQAALTLVNEHQARFPGSPLVTTREVTRAIALCEGGERARGRALASSLTASPAAAPFVARLRAACGVE